MTTGDFTRAQHPWLDDYNEGEPDQTFLLPERAPPTRTRKKSIRNAKDSAEMARMKLQQQQASQPQQQQQQQPRSPQQQPSQSHQQQPSQSHQQQPSQSHQRKWAQHAGQLQAQKSPVSRLGRHLGFGANANKANLRPSAHESSKDDRGAGVTRSHRMHPTRPLTPPRTTETETRQHPSSFYWHDGLHQSAAALNQHLSSPSSSAPALQDPRDSFHASHLVPTRASDEFRLPLQDHGLPKLRAPSFDSSRLLQSNSNSRSSSPPRPKTAGALERSFLEVPIPNHRLGTPQFSERGTAFLHNSLHTAFSGSNMDLPSQRMSTDSLYRPSITYLRGQQQPISSPRPRSPTSWFSPSHTPAIEHAQAADTVIPSLPEREITPSVYAEIAADFDNPSWAKFAPDQKEMIAATRARLIMEITSVRFLDYELLSDFFLTYRSFMTPAHLARYLLARLRWAVSRSDSTGRIVRVRTFVALRHWVLNYFMDDFEPDLALRDLFCDLVNTLAQDLRQRPGGGGGDYQVLNELKKCWKRTCDLVWSSGDDDDTFLPQMSEAASSDSGVSIPHVAPAPPTGSAQDAGAIRPGGQSYFNYASPGESPRQRVPESPFSDTSMYVTSCSIPMRKRYRPNLGSGKPVREIPLVKEKPLPEPPQSPDKPLQRRRSQRHQRDGSFSDALRDVSVQSEIIAESASPEPFFRGALIRGTFVAPNAANVVVPGPLSPTQASMQGNQRTAEIASLLHPDVMSNPSVFKLLGGVRRALSTRHTSKPSMVSLTGGHHKSSNSGDMGRLRGIHSIPRPPQIEAGQPLRREVPRSDALAALVARSWEESPADNIENVEAQSDQHGMHTQHEVIPALERPLGPTRFNSHVTTSSRSILIVDDTGNVDPTPSDKVQLWSPPGPLSLDRHDSRSAEIRGMSANYTAFLPPSPHNSFPQIEYVESQDPTTPQGSSAKSLLGAPLSPPPTAPLPQIPAIAGVSKNAHTPARPASLQYSNRLFHSHSGTYESSEHMATPLSQIGLALGTPSQQISPEQSKSTATSPEHPSVCAIEVEPSEPRLLRRRPGGNLRAVDTVQDLGFMRRRQSTGSLYSPSYSSPPSAALSPDLVSMWFRGGMKDQSIDGHISERYSERFSGRFSERHRRSSIRLLSTHSSQPNLRPSFEAEVRRLAALPADDEDGDIEATLLKLEGRFQPSRHSFNTASPSMSDGFPDLQRTDTEYPSSNDELPDLQRFTSGTSRLRADEGPSSPTSQKTETMGASIYTMSRASHENNVRATSQPSTPERSSQFDAASPELDKELKKWRRSSRVLWSPEPEVTSSSSKQSTPRKESVIEIKDFAPALYSPETSYARRVPRDSEVTSSDRTKSTFLLDDDESLKEATSVKIAENVTAAGTKYGTFESFFIDADEDDHNPRPPTPPATVGASSDAASLTPSPSPLLPGPRSETGARLFLSIPEKLPPDDHERQINFTPRRMRKNPPARLRLARQIPTHHTPFILAYSSDVLAGQFTLIEKDALDCIDWKDLVNLSWSPEPPSIRDWAQYTRSLSSPSNKISSVDLIIARFNLVIKWCISSVLLCATPEDRATCITKFIHIATYSHTKLHNFATTAQIAIGLLSSDLSRLTKTWELVPAAERETLRKMETLVSPVRNFAALRAEMESAAAVLDEAEVGEDRGVIPFVGVYTRDLALNAQKPAVVTPDGVAGKSQEQLVNFERHRTAATIVKGVLRLLDASSRYTIKPLPEVLSHCLWLAALDDSELASLSKGME